MVAEAIKLGRRQPNPAPMATAPLVFSSAAPGLNDSALLDLSWVSTTEGFALSAQPCATGTCARLARTDDGGAHWQALPMPPAWIDGTSCGEIACVDALSFASSTIGYLFGPALLMTTDGGRTWRVERSPQIETLTVAGHTVYRVAYTQTGCPGPCRPTVQEASVGSLTWRTVLRQVAQPLGGGASAQIISAGSVLLLAMYGNLAMGQIPAVVYRSADGGAIWKRETDPCAGSRSTNAGAGAVLVDLAEAGGPFAGLCSTQRESSVMLSADGARTWQRAGSLIDVSGPALIALASRSIIAVSTGPTGGQGSYTARLLISDDGGRRWRTAATDTGQLSPTGAPAFVGFETLRMGYWLGDQHSVWTTRDGGEVWTRRVFG